MTKERKIDLLYRKACGDRLNLTDQEAQELKKYKVNRGEYELYVKKDNIRDYVTYIDQGHRRAFSDWCQDNLRADRRRKGSSQKDMARENTEQKANVAYIGFVLWGLAVYWLFGGALEVIPSAIVGILIALGSFKLFGRAKAGFTQILLPIIVMVVGFNMHS